jgi:phosphoglycerol transferase MdoB-like AlkP superfamily enzyme
MLALFAWWMSRDLLRSVHDSFVRNVFEANLPPGRVKPFSPAFARSAETASIALPTNCDSGVSLRRNVVVVVVESLSAWQSALLGGPHDWLPRLDAVARANHYFTHFYANGFTTDSGEIALITGRVPLIPAGQEWYSLAGFGAGANTLPGVMHRAGGEAYYFTATDLSFLDSGSWLRGLGFDAVEGNESPFYAGMARTQFGAADDAALFARFENWLDTRTDARPFAAVLLTISSHPPFVDPRSGKIDPAGSFGYVDEQLAAFYERLRQRDFLDDGILLITGDHRSMTPLLGDEYRKFGERAFARVPMVVAGAVDMPKVVDQPFQQADLPASVAHVMGIDYCRSPFTGTYLEAAPAPAQYIVHARGDNRDRVDVYFDDRIASYRQDGDASHWDGSATPPDAAAVAAWINAQRIRNSPARETAVR